MGCYDEFEEEKKNLFVLHRATVGIKIQNCKHQHDVIIE